VRIKKEHKNKTIRTSGEQVVNNTTKEQEMTAIGNA